LGRATAWNGRSAAKKWWMADTVQFVDWDKVFCLATPMADGVPWRQTFAQSRHLFAARMSWKRIESSDGPVRHEGDRCPAPI